MSPADTIRQAAAPVPQRDLVDHTGDWVNYPPIPREPELRRYWFYGWRIDNAHIEAWVTTIKGPKPDRFGSTWEPFLVMYDYCGYRDLIPVRAVPEDISEPVEGVNYSTCRAWALGSNYSKRRFYTRPSPVQLEKMVRVLGQPYWFLDGLGDPKLHYQYYL